MNTVKSSKMLLEEPVMLENIIPHVQNFRILFSLAIQQTDVGRDKNGFNDLIIFNVKTMIFNYLEHIREAFFHLMLI